MTLFKAPEEFFFAGQVVFAAGGAHLVRLPEARDDDAAEGVKREGHHEEREADGEDAVVVDGIVTQVAAANAGDMPGHGLGGVKGAEAQVGPGAGRDGNDHRLADGARRGHDEGGQDT